MPDAAPRNGPVPPDPDHTPPAPLHGSPAPDHASPAPDHAPSAPDHAPPVPDRVGFAPGHGSPDPDRVGSAPGRTSPAQDRASSVPDGVPAGSGQVRADGSGQVPVEQGPGLGGEGDGEPLAEFVRRLREVGLDPDAEGLSDALWLARYTRSGSEAADGAPGSGAGPGPAVGAVVPPKAPPGDVPSSGGGDRPVRPPSAVAGEGGAERRAALYPLPQQHGIPHGAAVGRIAGLPVGVPAAPALPAPLELQRALRPLQAYRSAAPPLRTELDETGTAEQAARAGGLILPVYRAVTRGDARLQLVLEAS
ncbi:hypothetical protein ACFWIJ_43325, partial [Streptomyces sp. NPDC127079]